MGDASRLPPRFGSCQPATIHNQGGASDPLRHVAGKIENGVGDITGGANPSEWAIGSLGHELVAVFPQLLAFGGKHGGVNISGTHAVHANVLAAVIDSHGSGQVENASLGRAIGRGSGP